MEPVGGDPLAAAREAALRELFLIIVWWVAPLLVLALVLRWADTVHRTSLTISIAGLSLLAWGVRRRGRPAGQRAAFAAAAMGLASLPPVLVNSPRAINTAGFLVVLTVTALFFGMRHAVGALAVWALAAAANLYLTLTGRVIPVAPDLELPATFRIIIVLVVASALWYGVRVIVVTIRIYQQARNAAEARLQAMLDAQREVEVLQRRELVNIVTAGLTHDLANTVQTMTGTAALLEGARTPGEARDAARDLRRVGDEVAGRLRAILSVGRTERDEAGPTSVRILFSRLELLLRPMLGRNVTLALEPGADAPLAIGQGRLEQVLVNLALNARDAMPAGGVILVRSRPEDGGTAIDVTDGGAGIPRELLGRIWDPYFTTKAPGRGTGLGLAVVRRIVAGANGHVAVRSEPGRGSTFTILIPAPTT